MYDNNDYMYGVERSDEYLAHYGVRGMRWGVRKAIASGNSARLGKQYAKAQKKLAKLEKRAGKTKKYARRAALLGAGAAAAGGLAALGTKGTVDVMGQANRATNRLGRALMFNVRGNSQAAHRLRNLGVALDTTSRAGGKMHTALGNAAIDISKWGNSNSIGNAAGKAIDNARRSMGKYALGNPVAGTMSKASRGIKGVSNNTIARIGAGAVGAGLAAGAAHNAYRAATAKRKAERFRTEMNKAFAGTKYANGGGNRQGKKRRR